MAPRLYGLMAEFDDATALVTAAERTHAAGYKRVDAYSPFPIEALHHALGWRGSQRHWRHYEMAYLILAGLATPLVLSVHSIVSMDFAVAQLPGWHSTIFPPYFVAGALFSGFAMVLTLVIPVRAAFGLGNVITARRAMRRRGGAGVGSRRRERSDGPAGAGAASR